MFRRFHIPEGPRAPEAPARGGLIPKRTALVFLCSQPARESLACALGPRLREADSDPGRGDSRRPRGPRRAGLRLHRQRQDRRLPAPDPRAPARAAARRDTRPGAHAHARARRADRRRRLRPRAPHAPLGRRRLRRRRHGPAAARLPERHRPDRRHARAAARPSPLEDRAARRARGARARRGRSHARHGLSARREAHPRPAPEAPADALLQRDAPDADRGTRAASCCTTRPGSSSRARRAPAAGIAQAVYPVAQERKAELLAALLERGRDAGRARLHAHQAPRRSSHEVPDRTARRDRAHPRQPLAAPAQRGARRLPRRPLPRAGRNRHRGARHRRRGARPRGELRRARRCPRTTCTAWAVPAAPKPPATPSPSSHRRRRATSAASSTRSGRSSRA